MSYTVWVVTQEQQQPTGKQPKNIIGSRVREARTRFQPQMTQTDLAEALREAGISINQTGISKIENGERPVLDKELKAIGEALMVRVGWLIDEDEL